MKLRLGEAVFYVMDKVDIEGLKDEVVVSLMWEFLGARIEAVR